MAFRWFRERRRTGKRELPVLLICCLILLAFSRQIRCQRARRIGVSFLDTSPTAVSQREERVCELRSSRRRRRLLSWYSSASPSTGFDRKRTGCRLASRQSLPNHFVPPTRTVLFHVPTDDRRSETVPRYKAAVAGAACARAEALREGRIHRNTEDRRRSRRRVFA